MLIVLPTTADGEGVEENSHEEHQEDEKEMAGKPGAMPLQIASSNDVCERQTSGGSLRGSSSDVEWCMGTCLIQDGRQPMADGRWQDIQAATVKFPVSFGLTPIWQSPEFRWGKGDWKLQAFATVQYPG
ncbi:hypothetical protein BU17DRAFT_62646 [Hysterangium stoloniferum]|nr:hypothetical protein BU17DRAFT_62646 [Hysterangium stoloniferum]